MIGRFLFSLYRINNDRLRSLVRSLVYRIEGGAMYSTTIRRIYKKYYGIEVGMYTIGSIFEPYMIDPHTRIGRYCSVAKGVRIINHNHPADLKSTSPLFWNPSFGYCKEWLTQFNPIEIGNDVWLGANALILPEVNRIGDGAIIGAGAVVSRDVPPYAVVVGNPGRVVKYRFSEQTINALLESRWWEKEITALEPAIAGFQKPLEAENRHS